MVKKSSNNSQTRPGLKKGKTKRKSMFNELQTLQQQRFNQNSSQINSDDEEPLLKIEAEDKFPLSIGKQKSLEEICQTVNQLMLKKKIGVKNAFDVPIIDLFEIINFRQTDSQNIWKVLSSTFQNDSKIYSYRVDAIHSIAYSILNIMSRRSVQNEQKLKPEFQKNADKIIQQSQFNELKHDFLSNIQAQKTFLETNLTKINISEVQCNMASDPTLEKGKRRFDDPGLKGILMNSLSLNNNLELSLFSHVKNEPYSMKLSEIEPVDSKNIERPLKIFDSIQKIKHNIQKILNLGDSKVLTNKELDKIWDKIKKGDIYEWPNTNQKVWLDVQDPQCGQNFDLMIDENSQNENINRKFRENFTKSKYQKIMMTDEQIIADSEKWLNQIDKKYLGFKTSTLNPYKLQKKNLSNLDDDVNFQDLETYQRDQILRKQIPTKDMNENIEDQFLTTVRPQNEMKIQNILTLRKQPQMKFQNMQEEFLMQRERDYFIQKQIDIKRQMTSIKEIKQTIFGSLNKKSIASFNQVYQACCKIQEISPALCFLTLLHLANQKNLLLKGTADQTDFLIKLPVS